MKTTTVTCDTCGSTLSGTGWSRLWAKALLNGLKPVENRSWPLPPKYVNTPLLLHAGKAKPRSGDRSGILFERAMQCGPLLYGDIIGEITFGPSVRDHPSEWAEAACWHWPVVTVRELAFYPCRGQLRIFNIKYQELNV